MLGRLPSAIIDRWPRVTTAPAHRIAAGWFTALFVALTSLWLPSAALAADSEALSKVSMDADTPPHLSAGVELLFGLEERNNSYRHQRGPVVWPGDSGGKPAECRTDCSGLVNALLERSYGLTPAQLRAWLHGKRPLAKNYYNAIYAQNHFRRLTDIHDLQPGDVLAVRFPSAPKGHDTGHVMLVAGLPKQQPPTAPIVAGTTQWEMLVLDQTSSPHGNSDTRHRSTGRSKNGLGTGKIRLYSNASGQIVGYTWSPESGSQLKPQSTHPMVAGRLTLK